jgi:hypothetical protein
MQAAVGEWAYTEKDHSVDLQRTDQLRVQAAAQVELTAAMEPELVLHWAAQAEHTAAAAAAQPLR